MENYNLKPMSHNGKSNKSEKFHQKNPSLRNEIPIQKQDDSSLIHELKNSANSAIASESISVAGTSASPSSHLKSSNVHNSDRDDSLCDFRSPIKTPELDESLADFIIKPTVSISNKRLASRESKPLSKKKKCSRNVSIGSNQPSIESSFFKPKTALQPAFLCPLCFKSFKDATAQNNHMKSCAARNKISTKKLLDAIELQEKQANERKAMGLLTAPPIQPKKTVSRKLISNKDPQLQLALALSMSLHEAEVNEEIDDAYVLAGETSFSMNEKTSDDRRETLQMFGFTTNKPVVVATAGKSRKKRLMGPTPLQTRTQEERDRLLSVKIAEVLMGDEAITQAAQKSMDKVIKFESTIVLKSRLLQSYHCVTDRLWDKTQQRLKGWSPYSCNILEYTPSKASPEPEIEEIEPGLCTASIFPNNSTKTPNQIPAGDAVEENIQSTSPLLKSTSKKSDVANDKTVALDADNHSLKNLSKNWRTMFGSNYMSDVVVITKGNIEISGHLIVFWARCSNIMAEVIPHDPERCGEKKAKILWLDTCSVVANVFFEYIYCGTIDHNLGIFEDQRRLSGVRALARKYQLKELFTYLKDKSNELKVNEANIFKQPPSTDNENSESKLCVSSQNSIDSHSEGEASISSMKTDIYTKCRTSSSARANSAIINKSTSDNNISKENRQMKVSANSKDEYHISTSNDSCVTDIYTTGETVCEMMSVTKIGQKRSVTNSDHSDNDSQLINQGLKVERSVSPDIFDDATTEDHSNSNRLSQPHSHRSEFNTEYCKGKLAPTSKNSKIKSADSYGRSRNRRSSSDKESSDDETVDTSKQSHIRESERTTVDFAFVSTRRKQRSFGPFPDDEIIEIDTTCQQIDVPEPVTRPKGDVTMAIERIQRLNAKTASESDSEYESSVELPVRRRTNPFRRSLIKASSMIHKNMKDVVGSESDIEIHQLRKRNALSIFEQKLETAVANNPELFNLPYSDPPAEGYSTERESPKRLESKASSNVQNEELNHCPDNPAELSQRRFSKLLDTTGGDFDLTRDSCEESKADTDIDTCNTIVEDKDLSMFSKYKKNRRHNSISKYRTALQDITIPTFVSDNRVTDESLSTDICQSSDDGKSNKNEVIIHKNARTESRKSSSSKNKSSHLSQYPPQTHKELSTSELKNGEQIIISSERCNSTDSNKHTPIKQNDFELSDLEIDLSDFSGMQSSDKFSNGELNSVNGNKSTTRALDYRLLDGKQAANHTFRQIGRFTDVKLSDTKFSTVRKNGSEENNLSDVDTDTEHCVELSDLRQSTIYEVTERSEGIIPDIHDADTDPEEMKDDQPSRKIPSKVEIHRTDTVSREASKSSSFGQAHLDSSSSDCEIFGVFPPQSINFNKLKNVSDEVDALLDECKISSQIFRDSELNFSHHNSRVLSLDSLALSSTPVTRKENYNNIVPGDKLTDAESDLMVDITNEDSFEAECQNTKSSFDMKLIRSGREKEKETHDTNTNVPCFAVDSSSSDNSEFNIRKTQNIESYALSTKYKSTRKQLTQPKCNTVLPDKNSKSNVKTFGVRSISENILNTKPTDRANFMNDSFDNELARVLTPPLQNENISTNNNQSTPQQKIISENVTPLANYSAMKTPELSKELHKYGFKAQKRDRAKQLLRHIYNELHPLVPVVQTNIALNFTESSSEDERPLPKRQNRSKSFEILNRNNIQSQHETLESDTRTLSDASNDNELLENDDLYSMSQSDGDKNLETVFRKLLEVDINLHNKILTYEPLILEELHATLKAQGLKCKLNSLMDFLDEQCITFRTLASSKRNRTRHKVSPKKHQATQ
ncbi:uncharacterized protein LOC105684682 isoform X1 [Athalia rosae]|uniref:uncharacterized protein LOC105684682 isoform X1 n=1 Tax=Athalia rosae TaxID=37344 RepID=UPI0020338CE2|nr:uncharacterized protein LOC105684682 isoform X1 [Athalia rosae]XP_048505830.1 uncharacterized protein LOC105684682 isoform X1 [Athalia rosae]